MTLTVNRVVLSKKPCAEGLSASRIAGRLGSVSRNAVTGKVDRLGYSGHATTSRMRTRRPLMHVVTVVAAMALGGGAWGQSAPLITDEIAVSGNSDRQRVVLFSGADWAQDARSFYSGALVALNGDFSRDGFVFRTLGVIGDYRYANSDVLGGTVDGNEYLFDIMVGYQRTGRNMTGTVYIGFDYQQQDLSPDDPDNDIRGTETGFKVAADLETHDIPLFVGLYADYSTAFNTYNALLRVGYDMKRVVFGPEGAFNRIESDDTARLGGFATFRFQLTPTTPTELTLYGGHQFVEDDGVSGGATSPAGGEGAYGGLSMSLSF